MSLRYIRKRVLCGTQDVSYCSNATCARLLSDHPKLQPKDLPFNYSLPSEEKRKEAAEKTIVTLRETLQKNSALVQSEKSKEKDLRRLQKENNTKKYSDEESSSSERDALDPRRQQDPVTDDYKTFIKALPDCPMNRGFHLFVASVDAERCCFCPCGLKMKRWREQFNIEKGHTCETEQRDTPSKFTPNAIVDHLKQLGLPQSGILRPCIYHFCVLKYVEALYENYWGPSQGHKALYKQLSDGYKRAEAAENNEQLKMMKKVQDQLDAANKRSEELEENEKRFEEAMKVCQYTA